MSSKEWNFYSGGAQQGTDPGSVLKAESIGGAMRSGEPPGVIEQGEAQRVS